MNPEGRIVQVLARASGLFVGTYFERGRGGYVKIDGTTFHDPIYVGDPGAKGARPGDKVAVEMVRYPRPYLEGEGVITEILGPRGQPGVDTLCRHPGLQHPRHFDEDVLDEAREQAKRFDEDDDRQDRLDLRDVLTVTIDPATARDFDDAISLSRDDNGYWSLGVHIADVSHFVRPGIGARPRRRGTAGRASICPTASSRCSRRSSRTAWRACRPGRTRYTVSALHRIQRRRRPDRRAIRPIGDQGRPPVHLRSRRSP